jgi:hypothetical protein
MACGDQRGHRMAPDRTRAARDEHPHRSHPIWCRLATVERHHPDGAPIHWWHRVIVHPDGHLEPYDGTTPTLQSRFVSDEPVHHVDNKPYDHDGHCNQQHLEEPQHGAESDRLIS